MADFILSIDQGTSSTRVMTFDKEGAIVTTAQSEFTQYFPKNGWVEHDPEEIWNLTLSLCKEALEKGKINSGRVNAIGITNQRETVVVWERKTGKPVYNAIVWLDRRTSAKCKELRSQGLEKVMQEKAGLLADPYFSASKVEWILDNVEGARSRAERGELAFGTIDSFLLWRLTSGKVHATDITNASRTLLFNIYTEQWDDELCSIFRIPKSILPEVRPNVCEFGIADSNLLGAGIPITGMAGDQQAALVGQACFAPGTAKCTYGTGSFLILNTGPQAVSSTHRLLTTIGYKIDGETTYALEGSTFVAGAAIQWLRDGLKIIKSASESEALAREATNLGAVYFVPAFSGLGAPYWDAEARAAITGITRDVGIPEIVAAAILSVVFRTRDLVDAMTQDGAKQLETLRVDGGMVVNNWLLQALADVLAIPIDRPAITETTALGAAYLAGLHTGFYSSLREVSEKWSCDRNVTPLMNEGERERLYSGWKAAVGRVLTA